MEGFEGRGGGSDVDVAGVAMDVGFEGGMDELAGEDPRAVRLNVSILLRDE